MDRQYAEDAPPPLVSLAALPPRADARVVRLTAADQDAARLMALGVCVGRRVQVVQTGDPMIVRVVGARVGLSARLAAGVTVEPASAAHLVHQINEISK